GDRSDPRPEDRDRLTAPEQQEVTVPRQRPRPRGRSKRRRRVVVDDRVQQARMISLRGPKRNGLSAASSPLRHRSGCLRNEPASDKRALHPQTGMRKISAAFKSCKTAVRATLKGAKALNAFVKCSICEIVYAPSMAFETFKRQRVRPSDEPYVTIQ